MKNKNKMKINITKTSGGSPRKISLLWGKHFNNKNVFTAIEVVYINEGKDLAKSSKTEHLGFYDLKTERYEIKILRC